MSKDVNDKDDKTVNDILNGLESPCNIANPNCLGGEVLDGLLKVAEALGNTQEDKEDKKGDKKGDKKEDTKEDKKGGKTNKVKGGTNKTDKTDKTDKKNIIESIGAKIGCGDDTVCVFNSDIIKKYFSSEEIRNILNSLKPKGPETKFGLLSNVDIDGFLRQLAQKHKDFYHIPFQMRDFKEVHSELARLDIADILSTHNKFGVVFNTDYSSGFGIHWYCVYGEKNGNDITIEYFNSSGEPPLEETMVWLCTLCHTLRKKIPGSKLNMKYSNGIKFQSDTHSCGVYSIMYILFRVEGVSNKWLFDKDNFNDKFMHDARELLFLNKK